MVEGGRWPGLPPFSSRRRAGVSRRVLARPFARTLAAIYPGARMLDRDQEAGCVEQPRRY